MHSYPDSTSPGISTRPFILAAPTWRLVEREAPLVLKLVEKVPSTSLIEDSSSVVISGCFSVTTAAAETVPETPSAWLTASPMAAPVASGSTVVPTTDGVSTNSPFSLVMEASEASRTASLHSASTNAEIFSGSAENSSSRSTGSASRSFFFIYLWIRLPLTSASFKACLTWSSFFQAMPRSPELAAKDISPMVSATSRASFSSTRLCTCSSASASVSPSRLSPSTETPAGMGSAAWAGNGSAKNRPAAIIAAVPVLHTYFLISLSFYIIDIKEPRIMGITIAATTRTTTMVEMIFFVFLLFIFIMTFTSFISFYLYSGFLSLPLSFSGILPWVKIIRSVTLEISFPDMESMGTVNSIL